MEHVKPIFSIWKKICASKSLTINVNSKIYKHLTRLIDETFFKDKLHRSIELQNTIPWKVINFSNVILKDLRSKYRHYLWEKKGEFQTTSIISCLDLRRKILFTTLELDLDLFPLLFETEDFSLTGFFVPPPVTTSNIVGSSLIILNSRFLHNKCQITSTSMHEETYSDYQLSRANTQPTKWWQKEHSFRCQIGSPLGIFHSNETNIKALLLFLLASS